MLKRICVFCGSNAGSRPEYIALAEELGAAIARLGIDLVYGGGKVGLMGKLADAALGAGGRVIGIIPKALVARELAHERLTDLRVVGSMHERKALMAELAEGFVALPGGYGTLDEFCEILTWVQLGLQRKPCAILNVNGYYDGLLAFFDHAVAERFIHSAHREMLIVERDVGLMLRKLCSAEVPMVDKILARSKA